MVTSRLAKQPLGHPPASQAASQKGTRLASQPVTQPECCAYPHLHMSDYERAWMYWCTAAAPVHMWRPAGFAWAKWADALFLSPAHACPVQSLWRLCAEQLHCAADTNHVPVCVAEAILAGHHRDGDEHIQHLDLLCTYVLCWVPAATAAGEVTCFNQNCKPTLITKR